MGRQLVDLDGPVCVVTMQSSLYTDLPSVIPTLVLLENVVFIRNIAWDTTSESLGDFFDGQAVNVQVSSFRDSGRSKGWGLANFATAAQARDIVASHHLREWEGRKLSLRMDEQDSDHEPTFNLFISNLPFSLSDKELGDLFAPHDPYFWAVTLKADGRSRGHGKVKFDSLESGVNAIDALNSTEIDGREIVVKWDTGPELLSQSSACIYVGNLSKDTDVAELLVRLNSDGHVWGGFPIFT